MTSSFTGIDLSKLPSPKVIEQISFEQIFDEMLSELKSRAPEFDALVESDPAYKILQVAAYRETLLRQRINSGARSVMLAYAQESDLDNLGALFGVPRLLIDAGDENAIPPIPPVYEDDSAFRRRIQLAPEGASTSGSRGFYLFNILGADPDILDASVKDPSAGDVLVTILSRVGNGVASRDLTDKVERLLLADSIRVLGDNIIIQSASIINYKIEATLYFFDGPGQQEVYDYAKSEARKFVNENHKIGVDVPLSGIYAALHKSGISRVELTEPTADIIIDDISASFCSEIKLQNGGIGEAA